MWAARAVKMVALRATPWVRLTEPKWRTLLLWARASSTSSGTISQSAPRIKRKLRSPVSSTDTMAMVVGPSAVWRPEWSTPFSSST